MIKEINNKMDYDHLLTESDPNINLVRDYLEMVLCMAFI